VQVEPGLPSLRRSDRTLTGRCTRHRHFVRTERLLLRTPTEWEMAAAQAAASDPVAQRWIGWAPQAVVGKEDRRRYLDVVPGTGPERDWPDAAYLVAIHGRVDRCAGMVTVTRIPGRGYELGGWLAPTFRGRGLGSELFRAGLELGHEHLGLPRIRAAVERENVGSRRAVAAAGFAASSGPPTYLLENGRAIDARWYEHDSAAPHRCRGPQPEV
jgi:RimJ/RimL family protein N-acetyltransferase